MLTANELFAAGDGDAACFYDAAAQALNAHHKVKELMNSVRTKIETLEARDGELQRVKQSDKGRDEWMKEKDHIMMDLMKTKEEAERLSEELGKAGSSKISEALKRYENLEVWRQTWLTNFHSRPSDTKAAKQVEEAARRLRDRESELEREREEFSEAALRLGKEREALEVRHAYSALVKGETCWTDCLLKG